MSIILELKFIRKSKTLIFNILSYVCVPAYRKHTSNIPWFILHRLCMSDDLSDRLKTKVLAKSQFLSVDKCSIVYRRDFATWDRSPPVWRVVSSWLSLPSHHIEKSSKQRWCPWLTMSPWWLPWIHVSTVLHLTAS